MRISLRWLRELCPAQIDDDEIARRLTLAGFEIEGRERRSIGDGVDVVAARIVSSEPMAGSDHLSICQVDDGRGRHQVVCGARNFSAGDIGAFARPAAVLPGGRTIERTRLRGVESGGMLCSARELGLSDDHEGLLLLPRDTPLGAGIEDLLGLPDTIFDVNVTPNRPDALSHLGIARELSALTGVAVRAPAPKLPAGAEAIETVARVEVCDAARCPRYMARVVEGVRIAPSPPWLQERLRSCGVRPIGNVVDATNLALLELGHPLHAFDLQRLHGARIVVRRAREQEPMTTLDGKARVLAEDDLVIADADRPVALAGVMGGASSEVSATTARILIESAVFEPGGVRRTARRHGLRTEASHRFERGADEATAALALDRCAELILQLAGGRLASGVVDRHPAPRQPPRVWVRPARVSAMLGTRVDATEVEARLRALGLTPLAGDGARRLWAVPSWRSDLTREIDCVEEIARLRGLDTIPIEVPKAGVGETAARGPAEIAAGAARSALAARGFDEVVNYSFVPEADLEALSSGSGLRAIRVANPLTVEQAALRTTQLSGLLRNLRYNLARGAQDVRFYELGRVYLPQASRTHPSGPLAWPADEPWRLSLAAVGRRAPRSWGHPEAPLDFYDLKGAIEDLLEALGVPAAFGRAQHPALHPASAAQVLIDGRAAGVLGQIHPLAARAFEVPASALLAELDWEQLLRSAVSVRKLRGVPHFPAVARDLAFVIGAEVPAAAVLEEIRAADAGGLLEEVTLFDVYRGEQVPAGKKSVAYGLVLRASDRTLTDADADAVCAAVKERLKKRFGAEIRA